MLSGLYPLLLTAAANQVMPPLPIDMQAWIKEDEYPPAALKSGERGYFVAQISISTEGSPLRCDPVQPSPLSRAACAMVMKRARFRPAHDVDGRPIAGLYILQAAFRITGTTLPPRPSRSAMQLTVDRLPGGAPDPSYARIAFRVDADGKTHDCRPVASNAQEDQRGADLLGQIACTQIAAGFSPPVARDANGHEIASVQSATIRFDVAPPAGE